MISAVVTIYLKASEILPTSSCSILGVCSLQRAYPDLQMSLVAIHYINFTETTGLHEALFPRSPIIRLEPGGKRRSQGVRNSVPIRDSKICLS